MEKTNTMTVQDIIREELEWLRKKVIENHRALGQSATGQFEKELEVVITGTQNFLEGVSYTTQLVNGRKPGTMPPLKPIEAWIKAKGIQPKDDISERSLVWAIAKKIQKEGTRIWRQGGTDLLDDALTVEVSQRIIDRIGKFQLVEIQNLIKRTLAA